MLTKKDSPAQLSASDNMVLIDSSAGRVIVQLPPAAAMRGGQVIIKHAYDLDDVAARVVGHQFERIDGHPYFDLVGPHACCTLTSTGDAWWNVG